MWRHAYELTKQSVLAWQEDYAPSMGAAIAYYTVFSIAPLLLIVMAVAGAVWGREAIQGEVARQLTGLLGPEAARGVQALVQSADRPTEGAWASAVSVVVLTVGATTVFAELQSALDRIWQAPQDSARPGWWTLLRSRLLSLGFVLGLGFLLAVSLVLSAAISAFGQWASGRLPAYETVLQMANTSLSLGVATALFALMFKLMPRARIAWRDVWIGAVVTAILFEVGKLLIGLYIGQSISSSYAAAGSLVVLLVWVYYSAQIFLLGAEFTWVYAHAHGSRRQAR